MQSNQQKATHLFHLGNLCVQRGGRPHPVRPNRRQLLLQLLDLVSDPAGSSPLPAQPSGIERGREEDQHDSGVNERRDLALQQSVFAPLREGLVHAQDGRRKEGRSRHKGTPHAVDRWRSAVDAGFDIINLPRAGGDQGDSVRERRLVAQAVSPVEGRQAGKAEQGRHGWGAR